MFFEEDVTISDDSTVYSLRGDGVVYHAHFAGDYISTYFVTLGEPDSFEFSEQVQFHLFANYDANKGWRSAGC